MAQRQRRMKEEEEENQVAREDSSGGLKVAAVEAVHEALRREKVVPKKWRPKKVATPGTFLDTLQMSSSEENE